MHNENDDVITVREILDEYGYSLQWLHGRISIGLIKYYYQGEEVQHLISKIAKTLYMDDPAEKKQLHEDMDRELYNKLYNEYDNESRDILFSREEVDRQIKIENCNDPELMLIYGEMTRKKQYKLSDDEKKKVICALVKREQRKSGNKYNFTRIDAGLLLFPNSDTDEAAAKQLDRYAKEGENLLQSKSITPSHFREDLNSYLTRLK